MLSAVSDNPGHSCCPRACRYIVLAPLLSTRLAGTPERGRYRCRSRRRTPRPRRVGAADTVGIVGHEHHVRPAAVESAELLIIPTVGRVIIVPGEPCDGHESDVRIQVRQDRVEAVQTMPPRAVAWRIIDCTPFGCAHSLCPKAETISWSFIATPAVRKDAVQYFQCTTSKTLMPSASIRPRGLPPSTHACMHMLARIYACMDARSRACTRPQDRIQRPREHRNTAQERRRAR